MQKKRETFLPVPQREAAAEAGTGSEGSDTGIRERFTASLPSTRVREELDEEEEEEDELVRGEPVCFKVSHWSSQRDEHRHAAQNLADGSQGTMWESADPPEQWLVLDLGRDTAVRGIRLRCPGTQMDPREVTVLRGSYTGIQGEATCNYTEKDFLWILTRRCVVQAGPGRRHLQTHSISLDGVVARFLRIVFTTCWGEGRRVRLLRPLLVLGAPASARGAGGEPRRTSLSTMFTEVVNLSPEERELRRVARQNDIPLDMADHIAAELRRFDAEGRGRLGFADFARAVRWLTGEGRPEGAREDVCESRLQLLWQDVNAASGQMGRVKIQDLLVWFHGTFISGSKGTHSPSRHSDREAAALEHFYAGLGCERLERAVSRARTSTSF